MTDDATTAMASQADADRAHARARASGAPTAGMPELVDLRIAAAIAPLEARIAELERRIDEGQASRRAPFDPDSRQNLLTGLDNATDS